LNEFKFSQLKIQNSKLKILKGTLCR